ncbi:anthranilate phosphoribosyltransferase [Oceanobacillus picturae]|uniref:anthranilate phosphoribosyltransferase n=1 Tax=Oceanobacillus picturae TaxID=171693 RepID=UPI000E67F1DE|nr:anthranilate phosphoribosyltransferase [Oceanobacillus picturae]RIU91893.1 anthranilate phosphoribosyltransferase [Oceanobacillus picturae]
MKQYLEKLINQENLTTEEIQGLMTSCINGGVSESEIASFLTALRVKGETPEEIAGMVEVIRSHSTFNGTRITNVMDNCGTGGDQSNSFNISTTAAFVIAGAGIPVAKHGNRSISSKTGSADVLEHLGVSLSFAKEHVEEMLTENNIAFLFAPHVHAGLKPFSKVRKDLGLPTVFNLIGPLTNPVQLDTQLLGVYRRDMLPMLAEALKKLGRRRALVVNGAGYMDEASLAGENHFVLLEEGNVTSFTLHPEEVGLPVVPNEKIQGGSAADNAEITQQVLQGIPGPYLDTVLLNAGLGLYANGAAGTIRESVELARESIQSGAALKRLENLVSYSRKLIGEVVS